MQGRQAAAGRPQSFDRVPARRTAEMRPVRNQPVYREDNQAVIREMPAGKERYFYDYSLLFAVIFLFALGLLIIYSSSQYMAALEKQGDSSYYFNRQLLIGSAGLAGAIFLSILDYRWLVSFLHGILIKAAYWGSNLLLVLTLVMGLASHGKTRWISIAGISFQPAEAAKIGLILYLANFIAIHGPATKRRRNLLWAILFSSIPTILILKQNISSAVIVALIAAVMLFVAVDDVKTFAILGTLAAVGIASLKPLIRLFIERTGYVTRPEKYYLRRILGWAAPDVFPDDAYQTLQSIYAIGSGGMTGHGLGESIQKFGKIPEVQNDMIFAIVCEEFGFIGAATLIVLFIYIIYRVYKIAVNADDLFGTMICTGVMAHLGVQVVLNIAVVSGTIPNTGVTLPFISYGGSAILFTMAEIGLVLSVAHKIKLYH
jgi:cell division protein FtsW